MFLLGGWDAAIRGRRRATFWSHSRLRPRPNFAATPRAGGGADEGRKARGGVHGNALVQTAAVVGMQVISVDRHVAWWAWPNRARGPFRLEFTVTEMWGGGVGGAKSKQQMFISVFGL